MLQQPLESQKKMGPKVIQKEKLGQVIRVNDGDCEPEEDDEDQRVVQRIKVGYVSNQKPRFDGGGRAIKKGEQYQIQFIPYITVCLFDPREDSLQIRKQLEEYQTQSHQKSPYQQSVVSKDGTQITLVSNLKKK